MPQPVMPHRPGTSTLRQPAPTRPLGAIAPARPEASSRPEAQAPSSDPSDDSRVLFDVDNPWARFDFTTATSDTYDYYIAPEPPPVTQSLRFVDEEGELMGSKISYVEGAASSSSYLVRLSGSRRARALAAMGRPQPDDEAPPAARTMRELSAMIGAFNQA